MIVKDVSLSEPSENILYDEVLLSLAEEGTGREILRFWESSQLFIVLGRTGKETEDLKLDAVVRDRIPVLRRCSGGGTVLQGKGCLNYSLVLSKERPSIADLRKSYQFILGKIVDALRCLHVNSVFCPVSDIALVEGNKKISGNAQKRSKRFILHHGTILYGFDLGMIERYLFVPKDIPEYRQDREHSDFVTNINVPSADIKKAIKDMFDVNDVETGISDQERERLNSFLQTKEARIKLVK